MNAVTGIGAIAVAAVSIAAKTAKVASPRRICVVAVHESSLFTMCPPAWELKYQYTLCYYPFKQSNDGLFRRIQVTLDRPGAKIRARAGYRVAARCRRAND